MSPDPAIDRVAFAREVLGVEVFDHQAEALRATAAVVVACGGRRSGKTVCAHVAGAHCIATRRGAQWLVTGPNVDKIRQGIAEMAALLRASRLPFKLDAQALRLGVPGSGSEAIGVPPTGGQLRGYGARVYGAHVDEAGHCPSGLWRDLRYVLADHAADGAQAWLTGSPWGPVDGFFHQSWRLGRDGDPDYWATVPPWRTDMNPNLPPGWIERERARLNAIEAAAELDGEWVEDGAQFFPRALLDACVADVEMPELIA